MSYETWLASQTYRSLLTKLQLCTAGLPIRVHPKHQTKESLEPIIKRWRWEYETWAGKNRPRLRMNSEAKAGKRLTTMMLHDGVEL